MEQLSIFDFVQTNGTQCSDFSCRWLKDGDDRLIGKIIPFQNLKNMVGKKVIIGFVNVNGGNYRIVRITDYHENTQKVYKRTRPLPPSDIGYGEYVNAYIHDVCGIKECMDCYELFMTFDCVEYSDSDKKSKANCMVSEYYCTGGRWNMVGSCLESFYELNGECYNT